MPDDEAESISKPRNKVKSYKYGKKHVKIIISVICIFMTVISVVNMNGIINFFSYRSIGTIISYTSDMFRPDKISDDDKDNLARANSKLQDEVLKLTAQNEEVLKQLKEIKNQNNELVIKNRELMDDNIALQNSLKMAAAVGIKPQNFSKFNELNARGELERGTYLGEFLGTAYTPSKEECGNSKGITNSGKPIIPGVSIAIDDEYWPYGTVFYIRGLGYAVAMDTGNAIKGRNRFDFAVFDRKFALKLGTRYWDVYLVKLGNGKIDEKAFN